MYIVDPGWLQDVQLFQRHDDAYRFYHACKEKRDKYSLPALYLKYRQGKGYRIEQWDSLSNQYYKCENSEMPIKVLSVEVP